VHPLSAFAWRDRWLEKAGAENPNSRSLAIGLRVKSVKNGIPQLAVKELKRRIDAGEDAYILDVREPFEYRIANIGGILIPMNEVPRRLAEIDRDREVIVQCRSGSRSQQVAEYLKQLGYPRVVNLAGGILAWSDEIDPSVPKY
jgi:adenylyltransferase/sulfurtransferase